MSNGGVHQSNPFEVRVAVLGLATPGPPNIRWALMRMMLVSLAVPILNPDSLPDLQSLCPEP